MYSVDESFSRMHSRRFDFTQSYCSDCGIEWSWHPLVDVTLLKDNDDGSERDRPLTRTAHTSRQEQS